jgi:hypothetical protein
VDVPGRRSRIPARLEQCPEKHFGYDLQVYVQDSRGVPLIEMGSGNAFAYFFVYVLEVVVEEIA